MHPATRAQTPSRLSGVRADALLLNCGLWDVKTDPATGEPCVHHGVIILMHAGPYRPRCDLIPIGRF